MEQTKKDRYDVDVVKKALQRKGVYFEGSTAKVEYKVRLGNKTYGYVDFLKAKGFTFHACDKAGTVTGPFPHPNMPKD